KIYLRMKHQHNRNEALILSAKQGRVYDCGTMTAVFKADENETDNQYSVSEWWLEPHSAGPGAHLHEANDEVFYVLEGIVHMLVGDQWIEAAKGTFIRMPANMLHDFANRPDSKAGLLNFFIPGGF